jgi:hypothetical protein
MGHFFQMTDAAQHREHGLYQRPPHSGSYSAVGSVSVKVAPCPDILI